MSDIKPGNIVFTDSPKFVSPIDLFKEIVALNKRIVEILALMPVPQMYVTAKDFCEKCGANIGPYEQPSGYRVYGCAACGTETK